MDSFSGTMIEMNVHMQSCGHARVFVFLGAILMILSFILFMIDLIQSKRFKKQLIPYIVTLLLGAATMLYGLKIPKDRIISYCANGPVSIEQISAAYDIIEIDGKLIRLKERR
jgi:NADH:ubiquinone oxidoreductase subunit 6 (subunit J)